VGQHTLFENLRLCLVVNVLGGNQRVFRVGPLGRKKCFDGFASANGVVFRVHAERTGDGIHVWEDDCVDEGGLVGD